MRKLISIVTVLTLTGCANFSPYGGVSYHDKSFDNPEIQLSSGLGFIGTEYTQEGWGDFHLFAEHVSGLQTTEKGAGLNHIGFKLRK